MIILQLRLTGLVFLRTCLHDKNKIIWVENQRFERKIPTKTSPMQIISTFFGALGIIVEAGKQSVTALMWASYALSSHYLLFHYEPELSEISRQPFTG
jgi:hypothetical protein